MTWTPADSLAAMRTAAPLVHCITNYVAMNYAANVLLAAGASPAMVHTPEEAGDFAAIAAALTVNIGTLSPHWVEGMSRAIAGARAAGRPWVLDPVAHFATPYRQEVTRRLVAEAPTVIRGNASEILALGGEGSAGKGVDAGDPVEAAEAAARRLAHETGAVVAVTGEVDFVTDGDRGARIAGGSPLMPLVTATGCALTALTGAFLATGPDPFRATAAALAMFAAAGDRAGHAAQGPGSFAPAFLDALHALSPADLNAAPVDMS
ncbi:MAG: hydroxyethylthiazole kinase [Rhodobacteraceae bacterium]|nr:hydroxyethylthiazole kinase [Paracoccaceae bacterium]